MARPKNKRGTDTPDPKDASKGAPEPLPESNIPDPESIIAKIPFTSPTGKKFIIIRTNERDAYEEEEEEKPSKQ